ncbi:hypothetical protein N2152v2_008046 [Parachlorella kessleri]
MVWGGGQITLRPHLLSRDGKLLLVCVGSAIRVYSAVTAELLNFLDGHTGEVTSLALHPTIPSQFYSASLDGTIALWDLQDPAGVPMKSYTVGEPIESMVVVPSPLAAAAEKAPVTASAAGGTAAGAAAAATAGVAFLCTAYGDGGKSRVAQFDLSGSGRLGEARLRLSGPRPLVASGSGGHVAVADKHSVLVWAAAGFTKRPLTLTHTRPITCVAISPDGSQIAAGDTSGRIVIWHDLASAVAAHSADKSPPPGAAGGDGGEAQQAQQQQAKQQAPAATVHWHAHAVGCLAFSVDGTFLLSGGAEAVLVMWDVTTARKAYLPRLGGPLTGLAGCADDPAKYAIRQADNTIRVVNMAAMRVECSLHGLRPAPAAAAAVPAVSATPALAVQPVSGHLVLAAPFAMLQFYDALRDAHVDRLQVSPRNLTSFTEADPASPAAGPPLEPTATHVAFSRDGSAMATVEVRPDVDARGGGGSGALFSLKFWERSHGGAASYGQPYSLSTLADQPHRSAAGAGAVSCLAYHPTDHLVCTTSSEAADFRVWARQRLPAKAGAPAGHAWACRAVGSYRCQPMSAAAFSGDGSLLAVATGGTVTLWDAQRISLLGVLPAPLGAGGAAISHLAFLHDSPSLEIIARSSSASPVSGTVLSVTLKLLAGCVVMYSQALLVVAASPTHLTLFNLLTQAAEWCHPLPVTSLAADPASQHFAVVVPPWPGCSVAAAGTAAAGTAGTAPAGEAAPAAAAAAGGADGGAGAAATAAAAAAGIGGEAGLGAGEGGSRKRLRKQQKALQQAQAQQQQPPGVAPLQAQLPAQQQQQQQQPGAPAPGAVLVFKDAGRAPVAGWALARPAAQAVFALPKTPLHSGAAKGSLPGMSPLIILSPDRQFAQASAAGAAREAAQQAKQGTATLDLYRRADSFAMPAGKAGKAGLAAQTPPEIFGLEAMYGPQQQKQAQQGPAALDTAGVAGAAGTGGWGALFDAPSHVLPPPSTLCPAFLQLIVGREGVRAAGDTEQ